jgi:hypothetical protein
VSRDCVPAVRSVTFPSRLISDRSQASHITISFVLERWQLQTRDRCSSRLLSPRSSPKPFAKPRVAATSTQQSSLCRRFTSSLLQQGDADIENQQTCRAYLGISDPVGLECKRPLQSTSPSQKIWTPENDLAPPPRSTSASHTGFTSSRPSRTLNKGFIFVIRKSCCLGQWIEQIRCVLSTFICMAPSRSMNQRWRTRQRASRRCGNEIKSQVEDGATRQSQG